VILPWGKEDILALHDALHEPFTVLLGPTIDISQYRLFFGFSLLYKFEFYPFELLDSAALLSEGCVHV
jgi:hypothetical protein